jgi:hypothetical protein
MDAERCEPAGSWPAVDGRRPPDPRPDQGPTGRQIHELAGADAPPRGPARRDEAGERARGTHASIGHQDITGVYARRDRRPPGQSLGQGGRHDQLQEHPGARRAPSPAPGAREAAPRPRRRRLAAGGLPGRRSGPGASRALDQHRAMALPPAFLPGGARPRAAEGRQEAGQAAPQEAGAGLTVGRRPAPPARQLGPRAAGGVALEQRSQEERPRGHRREPASAPGGIPALTAQGQEGVGWQPRGPRAGDAWQNGRASRHHRMTSWTSRRCIPRQTGEAWRLPTAASAQVIHQAFCLTSCHSRQSPNVSLMRRRCFPTSTESQTMLDGYSNGICSDNYAA